MQTRTSLHDRLVGLRAAGTFFRGLRPFVRGEIATRDARSRLERLLESRERTFAGVLQRTVFEHSASPYRRLFDRARLSMADVHGMLAAIGLEGTLERLHDAGVFVELEEFKGLQPLRRPGLELHVRAEDFDNPLNVRQYEAQTGGSGGAPRRVLVGLDLLDHECAYHALFYSAIGAGAAASAMWLPAPPGAVGVKNALIRAKLGRPIERWFSQNRLTSAPIRHRAFAWATTTLAGGKGGLIPRPEFTPLEDAGPVARWLEEHRSRGVPTLLLTTPSAAVRVCVEAIERGRDISGSFFSIVGEPFTRAKAIVIAEAGCSAACHYAMVEAGMIGLACCASTFPDDVHLVSDKIATIERERAVGGNGSVVSALFHTTLLPVSPKVMLNVESGDYAVREERDCGCGVLPPAFRSHLHTIRSYEKLTSEGMHFLGTDLLCLLEEVLPARFGGYPTDYQLVEREQGGLPKVHLVVSPAVGSVDPNAVIVATLEFLRDRGVGQRLMAEVWATGETLQVVRAEPEETPGGKVLPLRKQD